MGQFQRGKRLVEVVWSSPGVLVPVDEPLHLPGRPPGLVQLHGLQDALDEPQLVIGVEDLESLRQARFLPMCAQQAVRESMKGANPHGAGRDTEQRFQAAAHLPRRLVGKGDRKHVPGGGAQHLQ